MTKLFLAAAGLVLIVAGSGLIFAGSQSYRKLRKVLERPWRIERLIYRHHRLFGGIVVAGALTLLLMLGMYHGQKFASSAAHLSRGAYLVELARVALWIFAAFALLIGIVIAIRPSAIKRFEVLANRWIEPLPTVALASETQPQKPVGTLSRTPIRVGLLLLLIGISCLLSAARMHAG